MKPTTQAHLQDKAHISTASDTEQRDQHMPPLAGTRPTVSLIQAPCLWIDQFADNAADDTMRYFRSHVEQITRSIDLCVARPKSSATVRDQGSAGGWLSEQVPLSKEDRCLLNALQPIQTWLRASLTERNEKTGLFEAPSNSEFRERLEDAVTAAKDAVSDITALTLQLHEVQGQLPIWLTMMTEAPAEGVGISDPMAARFEGYGVRVTRRHVSAIEWALLLAAVVHSLERQLLAASVAQQVASLSLHRGNLMGMITDKLAQELHFVRQRVEPDADCLLPPELQWLDATAKNTLGTVWGKTRRVAKSCFPMGHRPQTGW